MQFIARYKDSHGIEHVRRFIAKHVTHAQRKAQGIAASNKWKLTSIGMV